MTYRSIAVRVAALAVTLFLCAGAARAEDPGARPGAAPVEVPAIPATGPTTAPTTAPTDADEGLVIETVTPSDGGAQAGDRVSIHYRILDETGAVLESSMTVPTPMDAPLGRGMLMPGLDRGVVGMKVGETRRIVVPPELGYGARGRPPKIRPGQTVHCEVTLYGIRRLSPTELEYRRFQQNRAP